MCDLAPCYYAIFVNGDIIAHVLYIVNLFPFALRPRRASTASTRCGARFKSQPPAGVSLSRDFFACVNEKMTGIFGCRRLHDCRAQHK
jgi:hypothetical protein